MTHISIALRRLVSERADYRCEYCLLPLASLDIYINVTDLAQVAMWRQ